MKEKETSKKPSLTEMLEAHRRESETLYWEGTFREYFELVLQNPQLAQLSHARICEMILDAGHTKIHEDTPNEITHYHFFDEELYGIDEAIEQLVDYFKSAAQRLEVRKRILLLMGPVGGGKSTIVTLLKRGLEKWTKTPNGSVYAIKGCPMHGDPLHLIPANLRPEIERHYGIYVEGELSPQARYDLQHVYHGKHEDVLVERIVFSEKDRIGIGTFAPSDPKCVTGDTLLLTNQGLISFEDLQDNLQTQEDQFVQFNMTISGLLGRESTSHFYNGGIKPTRQLLTELGYEIEGSINHPVWILKDGKTQWVKLTDVQVGDHVALQSNQWMFGNTSYISIGIDTQILLDKQLAQLLGYIAVAGVITDNILYLPNVSEDTTRNLTKICEQEFCTTPQIINQNGSNNFDLEVCSEEFVDWVREICGEKNSIVDRCIPKAILRAPAEIVISFLIGILEAKNQLNKSSLKVNFDSLKIAKQIHILLLNIGITAKLIKNHNLISLSVISEAETNVLNKLITLTQKKSHVIEQPLFIKQTSQKSYSNLISSSVELMSSVVDVSTSFPTFTQGSPQLIWVKVSSIIESKAQVYDLTVPSSHSFCANGFINHNSQDISELTGSIDLSTIGEVGVESDPRAYRFDGELNIANRGLMEFVEMLKCDEKFLYSLLTLSQEQSIKTGRFAMIYADEVIVSHTNENEYLAFVGNKKNEALQDRIIMIKVPYNLRVSDEEKIYKKLLSQSDLHNFHIAPYTLHVAAMFAILTRLETPKRTDVDLIKKMKLYDGEDVDGFKGKDVKELKAETVREGMFGISPRYIINRLSNALVKEGRKYITPIDALRAIRDGFEQHTGITNEERDRYMNLISVARKEYDEIAKNEVQRAFVYSFEEMAKGLCDNYLDNVEAYCNKEKLKDPITDEELEPDERLMRSIEEQIGISDNAKNTFRQEILIRISTYARKGKKFEYNSHERLKEAIEKKIFADLKDVVKITTSIKSPDTDQLRRINEVIDRLVRSHGYTTDSANDLLSYVGSLLSR